MPTDPADLEFTADEMRRMGVRHRRADRRPRPEPRDAVRPGRRGHRRSLPTPARAGAGTGCRLRAAARPAAHRVGAAVVHVVGAQLSRVHPGPRAVSRGAGGPDCRRGQPLHGGAAGRAGARAARGERARLAARLDGVPRRGARAVHDRRVDGALQRGGVPRAERHLGPDSRAGVLYGSTQMHHSMAKSARLAGIMPDRVRAVPVDEQFRMDVEALADLIAADRRAGLRPFCVASAAGTTNTGAVDRWTPSPTCAPAKGSGTTWTAPTGRSSTCARSYGT